MDRIRPIGTAVTIGAMIAALLTAGLTLTANTAEAQPILPGGTAICANTDFALEHAADVSIGDTFEIEGHANWFFIGSGPSCGFGCHDYADFDCDNKLGNYCPIEINLGTVAGIHECMAHLNPEPVAAGGTGGGAEAVAVAVAGGQTGGAAATLAITGSEAGAFAAIGAGLIGFGALAMGVRRRVRD